MTLVVSKMDMFFPDCSKDKVPDLRNLLEGSGFMNSELIDQNVDVGYYLTKLQEWNIIDSDFVGYQGR